MRPLRRELLNTLMALPVPIALLVTPATAQEIPDFDSAAYCEVLMGALGDAAIRRCRLAEDYG